MDESPLDLSLLRAADAEATERRVMGAVLSRVETHRHSRESPDESQVTDILVAYARPILIAAGILAMVSASTLASRQGGDSVGVEVYGLRVDPVVAQWMSRDRAPSVPELLATFRGY